MSAQDRISLLTNKIQDTLRDRPKFVVIALLGLFLILWNVYAQLFMPKYEHKAEAKVEKLQTARADEEVKIPAEQEGKKEQVKTPIEKHQEKEKSKAPSRPRQETLAEKCRKKARLISQYSGPLDQGWKKLTDCSFRDENEMQPSRPGQTLEIAPAQLAGNSAQMASTRNGHGNMWRHDFYDRGNGQTGIVQPAQSQYQVLRGSVIPVRLQDAIDTQTPGQVTAVVIQDVKDSVTGTHTMIPGEAGCSKAGAVVIGWPDTRLSYNQNRLPSAWDQIVFPNGETMNLASFPGADRNGAAGLPSNIDTHFWGTVGRSLLLTITGAAADMARRNGSGSYEFDDAMQRQGGRELDRRARETWDRGGYRGPTGTVEAGEVFLLQVTETLTFPGDYCERERGTDYAERGQYE